MKVLIKLIFAGSLLLNAYYLLKNRAKLTGTEDEQVELAFREGTPEKQAMIKNDLLNINDATVSDLITLNGIGEDLAKRIIDDRNKMGAFNEVDELTRVNGLGEKKLDMFRSSITT